MPPPIPPAFVPLYAGGQQCRPGHRWGPMARDHHLFHLVVSGSGTFKSPMGEWVLSRGQGFLIRPGQRVTYRADGKDPWTYLWVGLRESAGESIWDAIPVGPDGLYRTRQVAPMARLHERLRRSFASHGDRLTLLARTYDFLAALKGGRSADPGIAPKVGVMARVERSVERILGNTGDPFPVAQLAGAVGLSPGHFTALFKAHTGRSPLRFQLDQRLERAVDLLRQGDLPVGEVAERVGFEDGLYFSRLFKKRFGLSPNAWRVKHGP